MKMKFSANKIYYNFSQGEFKDYKYVKFPQTLGGTLSLDQTRAQVIES